jgi:hypothetical protein
MKIKFTARAAKWFDRVNGNTYHSVRITNNETGERIYCEFQYGYGEQYKQTALVEMSKCGWIPDDYGIDFNARGKSIMQYERENDYPIEWIVTDGLKRDCIANGRI